MYNILIEEGQNYSKGTYLWEPMRAFVNDKYNISGCLEETVRELLRYHYNSKEVRLILKITFDQHIPLVIKFKNEEDINQEIVESQSTFSEQLAAHGIPTARMFSNGGRFVSQYYMNGYDVLVTAEEFKEYEIRLVDELTARKTGVLLANTHNIAEQYDCHVNNPVLFNPFLKNDLFFAEDFMSIKDRLNYENLKKYQRIMDVYYRHMSFLEPLKEQKRYSVQGDISNNNLFFTENSEVGMFDFNRCGDNNMFCDAIMQAVYEARLMDYPEAVHISEYQLFQSFFDGYNTVRPFTKQQIILIPHLYAVITAFWGMDIIHNDNALIKLIEAGNEDGVSKKLYEIEKHICCEPSIEKLCTADYIL